jgi:hypothetical protein
VTWSRGSPGDGTRRHRMTVTAMDSGGGAGQWWLWTARWWLRRAVAAMDDSGGGARWRGGGAGRRGSNKEVRWWLHDTVVLEDTWSDKDGATVQGR